MSQRRRGTGYWYLWNGKQTLERLAQNRYPQQMDTTQLTEKKRREGIVAFWKRHGLVATQDAYGVSRATLFRWQNDCTPQSRAHRTGYQKRSIPEAVVLEINRIRQLHPRLGKEKLTPLLQRFCTTQGLPVWSESTVGRILKQLKAEGRLRAPVVLRMDARSGELREKRHPLQKKKLRRGSYLPEHPGDLLQIDGVLKLSGGLRRYVFTAVDLVTRVAWTKAYPSASSRSGKDFLAHILTTSPFPVAHIQTDNGAEFLKEFWVAAIEADLVHFFNWVKQPKYQGWVERFNRTIQEEFIDWHLDSLLYDLPGFNEELAVWTTWYNTDRVHRGLNQKTPRGVQKYTPLQYLALTAESHSG
jgi:putative transposase